MITDQVKILSVEVIQQRVYDPQLFIRKEVLDNISQLDLNEIRMSAKLKEAKLVDIVFESLRDESAEIRKLALQILSQILIKFGAKESVDTNDLVNQFKKHKLQLVRLTQPVSIA